MGVRQPPARKLPNLTAARAVRALEVLAFHPTGAPGVAAAMGIHERTARRLLHTLEDEGYLQRGHGTCGQRYVYSLTPRLLALAGQLAARLPLVTRGKRAVRQLHESTGLDAYLVIPSYGDVIVLARAGDEAPALWSLLPATDSAGGNVLLAYRESWRDDQRPDEENTTPLDLEARASEVRRDGFAVQAQGDITSLAVPVPMVPTPLAALVLSSHTHALSDDDREALLTALRRTAARLSDPYHWRRRAPSTGESPTTLPITAKDRDAGWIRVPNCAKRILPADRAEMLIRLRGTILRARWNARRGPPERSGTLYIGRHMLDGLVDANEILTITIGDVGRIELN
ncbi:MAG: IclR family transcriptional regulator [Solirubrobacteraceae bacterium]